MGEAAGEIVGIDAGQIRGIKPLRKLLPLLASLHEVGCDRDASGNRELHVDQYVTLVLLMLFNPLIDSVRALQQAAAIERVSERLGVRRFSLGSFSESCRVFNPDRLKEVIRQLCGDLSALNAVGRDPALKDLAALGHALTAVDGTVLDSSPERRRRGGWITRTAAASTPGGCTPTSMSSTGCRPTWS
ncbi:MAG TPA: hypothetical protein VFB66_13645 [Tepidisphaeraceae bacterium]|nr:hypothetical protein [Tepidisphaeraceae bacterium]